jgi:predicted dehydrogenase
MQKNDAQASLAGFFCIQFFCLKSTKLAAAKPELTNAAGLPGVLAPAERNNWSRQDSAPDTKILIVSHTKETTAMATLTRRRFLEESMIAAGLAAAGANAVPLLADERKASANDTLQHAVIGCRIRGRVHAREFAKIPGVEVAYVCDPDRGLANELADAVEKQQGRRPQAVQDLRVIFDDGVIDTVSIAAPNHWHALAGIWAMQAGKDVFVEKPVSNTVSEGLRIVQVARKTNRICQSGTQNRSRGDLAAAAQYIRDGKLGDVTLARSIIYGRRGSIGPAGTCEIPSDVDFNLWLGPGTQEKITRPTLHYDWHWVWDTGNGELGNNNIHMVDICRWLLGLEGLGDSVLSIGGRLGYEDAGETPNTQMVVHTFGSGGRPATIIQEVRGLKSDPFSDKFKAGHVIHGTEGFIAEGSLFDPEGNLVETFKGPSVNHFANFIDAVRSRKPQELKADIVEGHQSSALCHIGNISHRLGKKLSVEAIAAELAGHRLHDEATATFKRMVEHLGEAGVNLKETPLTAGPLLSIDSQREAFVGNRAADALLTREYRQPFVVPAESQI